MEILRSSLFFAWATVTVAIFVVALMGAGAFARTLHRTPRRACLGIGVCLLAAFSAFLANPMANLFLFIKHREQAAAVMLHEIGEPTMTLIEKYGEPRAVTAYEGCDYWRYAPGAWYVMPLWEEVVYRVRDGRVQYAFIDD